jgi:hypothetical protein
MVLPGFTLAGSFLGLVPSPELALLVGRYLAAAKAAITRMLNNKRRFLIVPPDSVDVLLKEERGRPALLANKKGPRVFREAP